MFRTSYWSRLIAENMLVFILTYLGLYGMDILKPTKLVTNMRNLGQSQSVAGMFCNFFVRYFAASHSAPFPPFPTHILFRHCWLRTAETLARKATRGVKDKFNARIARKKQRLASKGKSIPQYYTTGVSTKTGKKTYTGGKDLHRTASYPVRFCSALYRSWVQAQSSKSTD